MNEVDVISHILEATPVCCKTLVEGYSITLIVFPVGDTWRNHPFLLLLGGSFAWRAVKNGRGGTGRATGNFFVLEARRF